LNKIGDKIFIDRDGKTFEHLINYLRNNGVVYPNFQSTAEEKLFLTELQFWSIGASHLDNHHLSTGKKFKNLAAKTDSSIQ